MNKNLVKRAIILAAGEGKRLRPLTEKIPKPLIEVNGKRMIDTIIQSLQRNGISEIYIVVGYLKEQFDSLINQYDGVRLIENPFYTECNNISSLYVARHYIDDCFILDGDQLIYNDAVLNPDIECSGYSAIQIDDHTDEWVMQVENDRVVSCSRNGGDKGWQLFSVSRWNSADGLKLKTHLEQEFETKHNYDIYWDDIPIFLHAEEYELGIYRMNKGDVLEIDNIHELATVDRQYLKYV